ERARLPGGRRLPFRPAGRGGARCRGRSGRMPRPRERVRREARGSAGRAAGAAAMTKPKGLLVYGANGYTGRLIVETALREGITPVVAARSRDAVEPLASAWGLNSLCFSLEDPEVVARLLEPYAALMLAAGPFSKTSAPALTACLASKTAYLDITG